MQSLVARSESGTKHTFWPRGVRAVFPCPLLVTRGSWVNKAKWMDVIPFTRMCEYSSGAKGNCVPRIHLRMRCQFTIALSRATLSLKLEGESWNTERWMFLKPRMTKEMPAERQLVASEWDRRRQVRADYRERANHRTHGASSDERHQRRNQSAAELGLYSSTDPGTY